MKVTLDSNLGVILDDPKASAVLEQYLPGITKNPMIVMVKGMSLNTILSMPQAAQFGLTKEKVEEILVEINKQL
jgi:hypothetical protein